MFNFADNTLFIQMLRAQLEKSQKSAARSEKARQKAKAQLEKKKATAAADPKKLAAKEKKEMNARKKKTLASLKRLTASPPPAPESSTDTSEVEDNVTAAILSTLTYKKPEENKSEEAKGPITRARRNNPK